MLKGRHQRTKDHNFNFFWWSVVSQAKIWLNLFIIPNQLHCKVVLPVLKTVCYETVASPLFTVASFQLIRLQDLLRESVSHFYFFNGCMHPRNEENITFFHTIEIYLTTIVCNIYSKKCVQYILQNTKRILNFVFYVDDIDYFVVWLF